MHEIEVTTVRENSSAKSSASHQLEELTRQIRERAYQLFECRDCEHGHDAEDWCHAEREVLASLEEQQESKPPTPKVTTEIPPESVAA